MSAVPPQSTRGQQHQSAVPPQATRGQHQSDSLAEQRERWERKRSRTARELVQSEQRYCDQLTLVNTYFVQILSAKGTLKQNIRETIFSSIQSIYSVNQSLLVHLENGYLSRGFESFCSQLHVYCIYVDNIYVATSTLAVQVKKNKAFRRFKKIQEARPEFTSCTLEELLQLPVQRIQHYKHFLQTLAENTSPDDPEFTTLTRSLGVVSEVFQRVEDNARNHDNQMQLRRVQKLMTSSRKTRILIPGRWYIREGPLHTVPPRGSEAKLRHYFLFSDMLLQARRVGPLHPAHPAGFKGQRAFPLKNCTVERVFGHTHSQGALLSLTFPQAKLLLMSCDQEDMNDWFHCLTSAITKLRSENTVIHQRDDLCRRPLRPPGDPSTPRALRPAQGDPSTPRALRPAQGDPSTPRALRPAQGDPSTPRALRPAQGDPSTPRALRPAQGDPSTPRALRPAQGDPSTPRALRPAQGDPSTPRPLRPAPGIPNENEKTPDTPGRKNPHPQTLQSPAVVPGRPQTPQSPAVVPGRPQTPQSPAVVPGRPQTLQTTSMTPGRKRPQVSEERTEHAQKSHAAGSFTSDEPEDKRMRLDSETGSRCVIL